MTKRLYSNDDIGGGVIPATYSQISRILGVTGRVVVSTSTALSLTATQHAERFVSWEPNSSGAATATLPAATGSGDKYEITNGIAQTQGSLVIAALGTDILKGVAKAFDTTAAADASAFLTTATSDKLTLNRTTQGGLGYDRVVLIDKASGVWAVMAETYGTGSLATPFSET